MILLTGAFAISACDMIDENDRFKDVDLDIDSSKRVLLEDFTGQECVNCPAAAQIAANLKSVYKENLILVSIHAGSFSRPTLRTPEGTEYDSKFHPQEMGYPAGMINRTSFGGTLVFTNPDTWNVYVMEELKKEVFVDFTMKAMYDADNMTVQVSAEFISEQPLSNVNFQLWLTESKIIAPQKSVNPDGSVATIKDYEHNHVLRGAVNGTWGEAVHLLGGQTTEYLSPEYTLNKKWVAENMEVIGFIYNTSNNEVLQCLEIPLIEAEH